MKKLMAGILFLCGAAVGLQAQETPTEEQDQASSRTEVTQQDEQQMDQNDLIAASELPAIVSEQLNSQDYSGWTMGNAYKKEKDGQTFYKVEMKSGTETKWVKFDAQGNKIKEKDKADKEHKEHKE